MEIRPLMVHRTLNIVIPLQLDGAVSAPLEQLSFSVRRNWRAELAAFWIMAIFLITDDYGDLPP
ncbi:MAG: hypothetical protein RLZZ496_1776 [Pseudomonadota bacterium]